MKTAKIGAIFLISILALAGASAGYAMWSEDLTINGTVNTGSVDVEWSIESVGDNEEPLKDVSSIDAVIDPETGIMHVTVTNAYPCITYCVYFDVHCIGSVPVHFTPFVIDGDLPASTTLTITEDIGYLPIDEAQLHTGDYWYGTLEIHLDDTIDNPVLQSHEYTFTVNLFAHQYND